MELKDKIVVVTGGGNGIGKALAERFAQEGARHVVVADIDMDSAEAVAHAVSGTAMRVDVASESQIKNLLNVIEDNVGPIDLFCSNAGIAGAEDPQASNEAWQMMWEVNVMAHIYVVRHLVPRMINRGGGYLLNTCSAAGLLNQVGGAGYGVTKHAAVGFGEWVAMTYAHKGIRVSLLCPQAVRTAMTTGQAAEDAGVKAAAKDGMIEPSELADSTVRGLRNESFLILPHPEVKQYMRRKTDDYDRWIAGMNRFHRSLYQRH